MKSDHDIDKILEKERPTLTKDETVVLWKKVQGRISSRVSPYQLSIVTSSLMKTFLIIFILILGIGGTVAASESAKPGDLLFPIERATERARIALASDDKKAELYSHYANKRLEQLQAIISDAKLSGSASTSARKIAAAEEERVAIAVDALVDVLEQFESDEERTVFFYALLSEIDTLTVNRRLDDDDDDDEQFYIRSERIKRDDDSYTWRNTQYSIAALRIKEIEVEVEDGMAEIEIEWRDGREEEFVLPFESMEQILGIISDRTGLSEAEARRITDWEIKSNYSDVEILPPLDDSSLHGKAIKEIEVEVEDGMVEIEIEWQDGREEKFVLPFESSEHILEVIRARTGLSEAEVLRIADWEFEDVDNNTTTSDE